MTLADLLVALGHQLSDPAAVSPEGARVAVTSIAYDSRAVKPGAVFVGLRGQRADGVAFANQALAKGAVAVIAETPAPAGVSAPWVRVADARRAIAQISAAFFGHPSHALTLVGVTGTNGKTTTAYLLTAVFEEAGIRCGRLGTVSYRIGDVEETAARTTPESSDLQGLLRRMVDAGCGACAMEVSSHALALHRADELRFAAAVFTNLTRDHLDFHGDMEAYFAAKRRLFDMLPGGAPSIVNIDDPYGAQLSDTVSRPVTYGLTPAADVHPRTLQLSLEGLDFDAATPRGTLHVRSRMLGRPNAYNILAAVGAAAALGLPFDAIERGLTAVDHVPGRFQVVSGATDDVTVVVDYAHTDDALKNLLEVARPLARARVITVFGCGGDRDRTKRPLMGAVAARLSDIVIITSDNPRSEDPDEIIEDVKRGIPVARERGGRPQAGPAVPAVLAIADRSVAIERAIREARAGDLVVVAGKGHEQYQEIGNRVIPFDDVQVARAALARRRSNSTVV
jgi:UDP-N-acetylmuramoyl-L-alanyl-D-glutamate--2,6-diaminopimelate ligase